MIKRIRRRNFDGDIQDMILDRIAKNWGGAQIFRDLEIFLNKENKNRAPPSIKTLQRMVRQSVIPDQSATWSLANAEVDETRSVLDILAFCIKQDIAYSFTENEAEWIAKIRKAAPEAPDKTVYFLAFLYRVRAEGGFIDAHALDSYLAFAPWKGTVNLTEYKHAVAKGNIGRVPLWSILVNELFTSAFLDPRFTGNEDTINNFENDIYERSQKGQSPQAIGGAYNIHPDDVNVIIQKYEKGGKK